jgi:hypothetical protein
LNFNPPFLLLLFSSHWRFSEFRVSTSGFFDVSHRHFINVSALISTSVNLPPVYKYGLLCSLGLFSFFKFSLFLLLLLTPPHAAVARRGGCCVMNGIFPLTNCDPWNKKKGDIREG